MDLSGCLLPRGPAATWPCCGTPVTLVLSGHLEGCLHSVFFWPEWHAIPCNQVCLCRLTAQGGKCRELSNPGRWRAWVPRGIAHSCCIWVMHWLSLSPRGAIHSPKGCRLHSLLSDSVPEHLRDLICLRAPRRSNSMVQGCRWLQVAEGNNSRCDPGLWALPPAQISHL